MGSFYGGGCLNGGTSGVVDYSSLQNTPITVLNGSSENNFISLSGLDFGHYSLKGYYKANSSDELHYLTQPVEIEVC